MREVFRMNIVGCRILLLAICMSGCGEPAAQSPSSEADQPAAGAEARDPQPGTEKATKRKRKPTPASEPKVTQEERSEESVPAAVENAPPPRAAFRPPDTRPVHDRAKVAKHGIHAYESKRLLLYTDLDPEIARSLPPLIDQAYDAWQEYFGFLPDNAARTDFQITGYIMVERLRFAESGLLPDDLPETMHGREIGAEFWMNDQKQDYYRRHLMIHEATHCFMNALPHAAEPLWYMEGMAEMFGTHQIAPDGKVIFGGMPKDLAEFGGWGRIRMIKDDLASGRAQRIAIMLRMPPNASLRNSDYAWFWAFCTFLDTHPRYRQHFRDLGRALYEDRFDKALERLLTEGGDGLREEWQLFATGLIPGFDIARAAIDFRPGVELSPGEVSSVEVNADRGWQSGLVQVREGNRYRITANGQYTLAQTPKPWLSEPQGISFRYFEGRPLGQVLAAIRTEPPAGPDHSSTLLSALPVGRELEFVAAHSGTLYFRINDLWSELDDNAGAASVEIREAPQTPAP